MTSRTSRVPLTEMIEAPTAVRQTRPRFRVAIDDGAGQTKAIAAIGSGDHRSYIDASLVALSTYQNQGIVDQASQPTIVQEALQTDTGYMYPGSEYAVGRHVATMATRAYYQMGDDRYTTHQAKIRLYAALAGVGGEQHNADIDLIVGVNASVGPAKRDEIEQFFRGEHVFRVGDRTYAYTVQTVTAYPQPLAAALHIKSNPPTVFEAMLRDLPFASANVLFLDGGNNWFDIALLEPSLDVANKHSVTKLFAIEGGVHGYRKRVAGLLSRIRGQEPNLREIERAMTTGTATNQHGKAVSISDTLQELRHETWQTDMAAIRDQITGTTVHYIVAVGGYPIVMEDAMRNSSWGRYAGFAIAADPVWTVARGLLRVGT